MHLMMFAVGLKKALQCRLNGHTQITVACTDLGKNLPFLRSQIPKQYPAF